MVTATLSPKLVDRLLQRMMNRHSATLVYVDRSSFGGVSSGQLNPGDSGLVLRLQRGGVPVAVLRRGDDLAAKLGDQSVGAAVG